MVRGSASNGCKAEPTAAERTASDWIVHLDSPEATSADRRRLQDWLAADPAHRAAYEDVARTRRMFLIARSKRPRSAKQTIRPTRNVTLVSALAAAAAFATIAILAPRGLEGLAPDKEYATRTGERSTIALPDGSTMELDAASVARVDFTSIERRIVLQNGTALFDVRRNPDQRPFVVRTPRGSIRVLGTAFVVQVSESSVRATVLRGVVRGEPVERGILAMLDGKAAVDGKPVTARANDEIVFGAAHVEVSSLPGQAVTRRLAWREGMLSFDDEPLRDAAAEVTRHTGVAFEFADPGLGDMRIGGYIAASDVNDFLGLLKTGLSIEAEQLAPKRIRLVQRLPETR